MYGGSTTSILLNIPGEAASIATCLDGYQMAPGRQVRPWLWPPWGPLSANHQHHCPDAFRSPSVKAMLKIGPGEEFSLMVLALIIMSFVSSAPILKTLAMILLGLLIATVGMDPFTAYPRFTFGYLGLANGVDFVPMAIGLFGVSEILMNFEEMAKVGIIKPTFRDLFPRWKDLRDSLGPISRGSVIGLFFGFIPGISHVVSTFISYAVEKKLSRHPEEFGKGGSEGSRPKPPTMPPARPWSPAGPGDSRHRHRPAHVGLAHPRRPGADPGSSGGLWGSSPACTSGTSCWSSQSPLVNIFVNLLRIPMLLVPASSHQHG
jgi:putative tricarboxylic transport membrane protein